MPQFEIIEAKPWHCGQMVRMLRQEHAAALAGLGVISHRELNARFEASTFRRAWLIDGKIAGLGGVVGTRLSLSGQIWLALSDEAMKYPTAVVRTAQSQIEEIMQTKRVLVTLLLDEDERAKKFAKFLGFEELGEERLSLQPPYCSTFALTKEAA